MNMPSHDVFKKLENPTGKIDKVIAVMSGKGGVGKSTVTSLLAVKLMEEGKRVGILDGDITGPSIPKYFGITEKAISKEGLIQPIVTPGGIKLISINVLLENNEDPVIWRGPVLGGVIKQFFEKVNWGDLDVLLVDLPPGTGDVPLTVMQSLPIDGIVMVTSPQSLVSMIVNKAVIMTKKMNITVLGLVENMAYAKCPDCGKRINIFGVPRGSETSEQMGVDFLGEVYINPEFLELGDQGKIEEASRKMPDFFKNVSDNVLKKL